MDCLHEKQTELRRSVSTPSVNTPFIKARHNDFNQLHQQEIQEINETKLITQTNDNNRSQINEKKTQETNLRKAKYAATDTYLLNMKDSLYSNYLKTPINSSPSSIENKSLIGTYNSVSSPLLPQMSRSFSSVTTSQLSNDNSGRFLDSSRSNLSARSYASDNSYSTKLISESKRSKRRLPPPPIPDEDSIYESSTTAYSSWSSNQDLSALNGANY